MTLYAAMRESLLVVEDESADPTVRERLRDHRFECVAVSPEAPERVFCGTFESGLHRSTDGGETFDRVGTDALPDAVMSLAVCPHDPETLWVGTEPSRVFRSTDGGETFEHRPGVADLPSADEWYFPPRPDTHHVRWIEPDPHDADRLYVGIEAGALVLTDDAGATWRERPPGSRRDNHSLATHPDDPGRVYAAAGDGYAESTDGGESWEHPQEGLDHHYCWSVAPDPGDPDTVLCSAAHGARAAHSLPAESYVYRRRGDDAWERIGDGLATGEGVLRPVLAAVGPGEFYAVSNRGVFRSTDAGTTWTALDVPWSETDGSRTAWGLAVVAD